MSLAATLGTLRTGSEPDLFPLADGGWLAKWTYPDGSTLHIEFDDDGDVTVALDDCSTGRMITGAFADTRIPVQAWLDRRSA